MSSPDPKIVLGRWAKVVLLLLVLIPVAFNAIMLFPELSIPVPSLNDNAVHYLFVQRASDALAAGENPFDHWIPELDLGFPQFFYYQHLPHLAVVLLHRLLLKQVDLLTLFNLIRYLLLIGFPLTVYWSMRRLGFSAVAGAVGAAASTFFSSNHGYGLEYGSYIWRGFGMYTQLWAVHLSFITLASLYRLLDQGKGYVAAIITCSILFLSHLIYAYIIAVAALVLWLVPLNRANWFPRLTRLAVTAVLAAVISSYLWLPWLYFKAYMGVSPYLQRWKYDSFGAGNILSWLANGDLLDYGRLPVLTILVALGIASAVIVHTRHARISLVLFFVMLMFFFGRATWGRLADLLPIGEVIHFLRFLGGVHLSAILLVGLGGELIWRELALLRERWRAIAAGLIILALLIPALRERHAHYALNTQWMERTRKAIEVDEDARTILSALKELPPGRTYAGLRANWGKDLRLGDVHFYDLLTFYRIVGILPPYQGHSLNADLIWHFDDRNPAHYNLFNVRYVIVPGGMAMPDFLRPFKKTPRYTLYQAETSGYAQFVTVAGLKRFDSQSKLFFENRNWLMSGEPAAGRFVRYEYPRVNKKVEAKVEVEEKEKVKAEVKVEEKNKDKDKDKAEGKTSTSVEKIGSTARGKINEEKIYQGKIGLKVESPGAATLVLKVTYHPNWRVFIDSREVQTFMVSPSFIGFEVPAGLHEVRAEYCSPTYKTFLLLLGACILLATIWFRRRFPQFEALLINRLRSSWKRAKVGGGKPR
jgi:hypothetical protein